MKLSPADAEAVRAHVTDALLKTYGQLLKQNFLLRNQIVQELSRVIEGGFNHLNQDREVPYTIHAVVIHEDRVQMRWVMGQARGGPSVKRITREAVRDNPKFLSSYVEPRGHLALELAKLNKMKQYL